MGRAEILGLIPARRMSSVHRVHFVCVWGAGVQQTLLSIEYGELVPH
jgi:hypothetical protein